MSNSDFNKNTYNGLAFGAYIDSAPHLRHESIRNIYACMVRSAFDKAAFGKTAVPIVLDLGAGEGTVTRQFLELGATVLAVDISERQLDQLKIKCANLPGKLELRCADLYSVLNEKRHYDIVVANSLLHHIPDYVDLVRRASALLLGNGVFFCFQDPMWKPIISRRDAILSSMAYTTWRLGQGDLIGGIWRRLRRMIGVYSADSVHDNTEFHAVRSGVNQHAISECLESMGFACEIVEYCSFHSNALQPLGEKLGVKNTFGLLATRKSSG